MSITLTPHQEQVIEGAIRAGLARSVDEFIEKAAKVLRHDTDAAPEQPQQPLSEVMREIWGDMREDVRAKLPRDGASQVDHYVYGLPKRDL